MSIDAIQSQVAQSQGAQGQSQATQGKSNSDAENAGASLAQDFDTFLALLTTQLQHQDPLDPLDSNEFTQQLVSFTGVEQQIAANKNLEKVIDALAAQDMASSVNYIGKDVVAETNKAHLKDGQANWVYELESSAETVELTVKNAAGITVQKLDGETAAGSHAFNWDGLDAYGSPVESGYYTLEIKAKTAGDNDVKTRSLARGTVDGVERVDGQNMLSVNGLLMSVDDVQAVVTPQTPNTPTSDGG